jgi:hypothetical protein
MHRAGGDWIDRANGARMQTIAVDSHRPAGRPQVRDTPAKNPGESAEEAAAGLQLRASAFFDGTFVLAPPREQVGSKATLQSFTFVEL